jgi:hypothetical protein
MGYEKFEEILLCMDNKDSVSLEKLFSKDIEKNEEFITKLNQMMNLWEGDFLSKSSPLLNSSSYSTENGTYTKMIIRPIAINIETTETVNNNYCYKLSFCYIVTDSDKQKEGLYFINLEKYSDKELIEAVQIGEPV